MVIGVPRGTLGCGLLDQSVYLVLILCQDFRYLFDFPAADDTLTLRKYSTDEFVDKLYAQGVKPSAALRA